MYIKNTGIINYIALMFFMASWLILSSFMRFVSPNLIVYILKSFSRYIVFTLAIILIFKDVKHIFDSKKYKSTSSKLEKLLSILQMKVCLLIKFPRKNKQNKNDEKNGCDEPEIYIEKSGFVQDSQNENTYSELHKIQPDQDIRSEKNKTTSRKCIIIGYAFFILLQAINAYVFLKNIFTDLYFNSDLGSEYILGSMLIILAICAFILKKFSSSKEVHEYNTTAGYCAYFGSILFVSAIFFIVQIMFSLDYIKWLVLVLKIASVYLVISLSLNILLSFLKKEGSKYNYQIYIPFINGTVYNINDLLKIFEENTNISIKSLWSLQYLLAVFPAFILSIAIILSLSTCIYKIEPYQEGAVYRLGKLTKESIKTSGLHIKYPWPIDKLETYSTKREKSLQIGYKTTTTGDFLWTVPHEGGEYTLVLGNGNELVAINAKVNYCIEDLFLYLHNYQTPESLLSDAAYELLTYKTVTKTLNNFLMEDRTRLSEELKNDLSLYCKENNLGLEVKNVVIQSVHPAVEVADVYQGVVGAGIEKQSRIIKAEAEASRLIAEAEKDKEGAIMAAVQNQTEKLALAKYEISVYEAAYDAYKINTACFKLDKFLDTYEKIISDNKLYVFSPKASVNMHNYVINKGGKESQAIIIN